MMTSKIKKDSLEKNDKGSSTLRNIPLKNYFIVLGIIVGICLLTFYIFEWYKVYQEEKIRESYLSSTNTIIYELDVSSAKSVFSETPNDYFVYVSYVNDKDVYELEKELKPVIDDYGLKNNFYFLNVTNIKDDSDYLDKINEALGLKEYKIDRIPTIVYFSNGTVSPDGILKREDKNIIKASDFVQMLEVKEVVKEA